MNIKFEDLTDDDAVIICNPTDYPHVENVTIKQCDFCGRDVWFADSTKTLVPEEYYIACCACAGPNIKDEVIAMPTDEQLKDVANNLGLSFEVVKEKVCAKLEERNKKVKFEQKAKRYKDN